MKVKVEYEAAQLTDGVCTRVDVTFTVVEKGLLERYNIFRDRWVKGTPKFAHSWVAMNPMQAIGGYHQLSASFPTFKAAQSFAFDMEMAIHDAYVIYKSRIAGETRPEDFEGKSFVINTEKPEVDTDIPPVVSTEDGFCSVVESAVNAIAATVDGHDVLHDGWANLYDDQKVKLRKYWQTIIETRFR